MGLRPLISSVSTKGDSLRQSASGMLYPDVLDTLAKGVSPHMRPFGRSQVAAALVVFLVGLVTLLYEFRPVQGASADLAALAAVGIAVNQVEQEAWASQRQQVLLTQAQQALRWEEQRREEEALVVHRRRLHQETGYQRVSDPRLDDLVPEEYRSLVLAVAAQFGLDPRLVAAVATVESRWQPTAVGSHQSSGLMQILPSTAAGIAAGMGLEEYDLFDPYTNLAMGAWYLHSLYQAHGDWPQALAAYNGGPSAAPEGLAHPYTKRVLAVYYGSSP